MNLQLDTKVARAIEKRAMEGIDPRFGTRGHRRTLIRLAMRDGKCCAHCGKAVYFI